MIWAFLKGPTGFFSPKQYNLSAVPSTLKTKTYNRVFRVRDGHQKVKGPDYHIDNQGLSKKNRRRSTLPHSLPCSTIDAKELNFRVRDGYGCGLFAITTGYTGRTWYFRKLYMTCTLGPNM